MSDEKFENYLREFEPKKPRTLPVELTPSVKNTAGTHWKRLVAAAAIALACGTSLWTEFGVKQPKQQLQENDSVEREGARNVQGKNMNGFMLTRIALDDVGALSGSMEETSRKSLPGFEQKDSALRVLARE